MCQTTLRRLCLPLLFYYPQVGNYKRWWRAHCVALKTSCFTLVKYFVLMAVGHMTDNKHMVSQPWTNVGVLVSEWHGTACQGWYLPLDFLTWKAVEDFNRNCNFSLSWGLMFHVLQIRNFLTNKELGLWVCRRSARCQYCCQVWLLRLAGDCAVAQMLS